MQLAAQQESQVTGRAHTTSLLKKIVASWSTLLLLTEEIFFQITLWRTSRTSRIRTSIWTSPWRRRKESHLPKQHGRLV